MQLHGGVIERPQKVVLYGPEGIGKTYFASKFPKPVFIDTEGGTSHFDVIRTPEPSSWTMLMEQVKYFTLNPNVCDTLIIDTADWAEKLCVKELCATAKKDGIEGFGYGKGYTYLAESFGKVLNGLTELITVGITPVLVAHASMRKFEQPDELGSYDRWEMKLTKYVGPMVREWADIILFANYKTHVVNVDGRGAQKGKNKVQGGQRVMYTTHHPCWDAKNRHDLLPEFPFDFDEIRHCIPVRNVKPAPPTRQDPQPNREPISDGVGNTGYDVPQAFEQMVSQPPTSPPPEPKLNVPKPLADLMQANNVTVQEIQQAVASKGYYPEDTPIDKYDPGFIDGVLVGAWTQVFAMINDARSEEIPF